MRYYEIPYKNKCEGTLQYVDMKKSSCMRFYYDRDSLMMEMRWIQLEAEHPANGTGRPKRTGRGLVEIIHPALISGRVIYRVVDAVAPVKDLEDIHFRDIEVRKFDIDEKSGKLAMEALFEGTEIYERIELAVNFASSRVSWD